MNRNQILAQAITCFACSAFLLKVLGKDGLQKLFTGQADLYGWAYGLLSLVLILIALLLLLALLFRWLQGIGIRIIQTIDLALIQLTFTIILIDILDLLKELTPDQQSFHLVFWIGFGFIYFFVLILIIRLIIDLWVSRNKILPLVEIVRLRLRTVLDAIRIWLLRKTRNIVITTSILIALIIGMVLLGFYEVIPFYVSICLIAVEIVITSVILFLRL